MSTGHSPPPLGGINLFLTAVYFCVIMATACVSATNGPSSSCCLSISDTKVRQKNIVNYTVQRSGRCPVEAVVFQTRKGKKVCSDPRKPWVVSAMEKVDKLKEKIKRERAGRPARRKAGHRKQKRRQRDRTGKTEG